MDALLITLGVILVLVGLVGAIVPGIPGPALSYVALILLQLTKEHPFTEEFLVVMGLIMAAVTLMDYVVPIYGTKKLGGSKRGVTGSAIGLFLGMFVITLGPLGLLGIILGPFLGAYIAEVTGGKSSDTALKAAFGSFLGFIAGTFMKFVYSVVAGIYFFIRVF